MQISNRFKCIQIENSLFVIIFNKLVFFTEFDLINAALVSRRDIFQKHKKCLLSFWQIAYYTHIFMFQLEKHRTLAILPKRVTLTF